MQQIRGRRTRVLAATAMAVLLLVGAAGCGGGSGSDSSGSDGGSKSTQSDGGSDTGDAGKGGGDLPNPCDLVPIEKASEILGGESAEPDAQSSDLGVASKSCSWQTQASIDNPTLDGAGHILLLQVISAPDTMSMDDFWKAASDAAPDGKADIEGCDEAFWQGGMLSAYQDGVYLTGSAGLADASEDAKASVTDLVSTACTNV